MDTCSIQNNKIRKGHIRIVVYVEAYDVTGQDKSMYYGQIQEIWKLDFHSFKIPLFCCN
jgi:hypothetical protein